MFLETLLHATAITLGVFIGVLVGIFVLSLLSIITNLYTKKK